MSRVSRRHGRLRLRLEPAEVQLLATLLDQLDAVLEAVVGPEPARGDEVLARLFPAAYRDDDEAEAEYRSLTQDSLRSERSARIDACRAELAGGGEIELTDPAAASRWIQVFNDLRLALGTRLGITQADDDRELDPSAPDAQPRVVYYWLTALQDSVVQELLG